MPPRENPTARQARLGGELRKLRERAGKTAREAAAMISTDQAKISHIEAGRIGVSEDRIRQLTAFYECGDEALVEALCAIAREKRGQHWWDDYRGILAPGFLDIADLEHHATSLRYLQPVTFPGILQTEDYAQALFASAIPQLSDDELKARVEHRMKRREILERDTPSPFQILVHEAALRMRVGGRKVARRQLEHLLSTSEHPGLTLQVIPFTREEFIEVTQTVMYAGGVVPQLDTVHIDTPLGGRYLGAVADLDRYRTLLGVAEQAALTPEESQNFIHRCARDL
ncbi:MULTISPECIES: helix-turn-helix domain-containing protein [Streptomyces]|uniref:Helix-turn-helix domain-containing protein n=1 Tax=Streptomyces siderophoricus TaxID=2802281 RepID=A0ABS1MRF6_9ACTN|nr:helix-turn-helix transcriptional regulator [Streptomyces sp. 9-7]MBL1090337.1 helix-turn-helix domain-containing protein [Streptomyces sp. 9-7]